MAYSRIGYLQFKKGTLNEAILRARKGLAPLFKNSPGFISYQLIGSSNDRGVSISIWDTRQHAESAEQAAADWIRKNTADLIVSSDFFLGDVAFDSRSEGGKAGGVTIVEALQDAFNQKDLDRSANLVAPDMKVMSFGFGKEMGYRDYMQNWATAFPDGKVTEAKYFEEGNRIVSEFIGRGTQTGPLQTPMGVLPPTNRRVEINFVEVYDFRDGKVSSMRSYFDGASFLRQLGIESQVQLPRKPAAAAAQQPMHH